MTEERKTVTTEADEGSETRAAEGTIEIDAPLERVWRALTEAADLERWFPLEARVEPGEGGSIWMSWKNEWQGESKILVWEPPHQLRVSWDVGEEDTGFAQVTDYVLEARGGKTHLRVVTSGFAAGSSWDGWVEAVRRGWRFVLESLKCYIESHDGEDREVVYLRQRTPLSYEESWDRLFGPDGFGGQPPRGTPFDNHPPVQYAAVVDDPPGAMMRVTNEPAGPGDEGCVATLWLSAWGEHKPRLAEIEAEWRALLHRLYPEGESAN